MAKQKKIGNKIKTKNFIISNDAPRGEMFNTPWEVKRRGTKKALKENENLDTEKVLMSFTFSEPDKYSCTSVKVEFIENLTKAEYDEILKGLNDTISYDDKVVFIKIDKNIYEGNKDFEVALDSQNFGVDVTDENALLWEKPVTEWGPIFMLLGLSIGMSISQAINQSPWGMGVGAMAGFAIGTALKSSEQNKRKELHKCRNDGTEPPKK